MAAPRSVAARETRTQYWTRLVRGSVVQRGTPGEGALLDRIIAECVRTDEAGAPVGVWHAVATVTGRPCWCARCRP
jgi:hypothetical protein